MRKIIRLNLLIILVIAFLAIATETISLDSRQIIQEKVEGDPFYVEEMINALIDSKYLSHDNGGWRVTIPTEEYTIPSTNNGVLSARHDRLNNEIKQILQEG